MSTKNHWMPALAASVLWAGLAFPCAVVSAQGGTTNGGFQTGDALITPQGFNGDAGGFDNQTFDSGNTGTGTTNIGNTGSGGGSTGQGSSDITIGGLIEDLGGTIEPPPNDRYFGFVGPSGDRLNETGFVGGYSEFIGPSAEGSFGGSGFNDSSGNATRGGGGAGAGGNATGLGQNVNGFTVSRPQPIRTRTVPNFSSPTISVAQRSARINRFMARMPKLRGIAGNVNVSMQGRTAIINGTVENAQQLQLIERQLRLEPGVSRIENQARVGVGF